MTEKSSTPTILNLAGELPMKLRSYFKNREITVTGPDAKGAPFTHILVANVEDFSEIGEKYQTIQNDIRILSLTEIKDPANFIANNGKFYMDESWLSSLMGHFILDKFFQEYSGLTLGDNYPAFKELGSFVITNPFSTGEYLDRLVFQAMEKGINGLILKSYFDHLLMYLTYQRSLEKVGFPLEIAYGNFDEVFGLQLHFFTNGLNLDELQAAYASTSGSDGDFLKIASQNSEFLDFTYLQDVNKIVITGLWTKNTEHKARNKGVLISKLFKAGAMNQFPNEGLTPFLVGKEIIPDMTATLIRFNSAAEKKSITKVSGLPEKEDKSSQTVKGRAPEKEALSRVSGGNEKEDDFSQMVKGEAAEKEALNRIKGAAPAKESANKIKGLNEQPEASSIIKGSESEKEASTKIGGGQTKEDGFSSVKGKEVPEKENLTRINGRSEDKASDIRIKSLGAEQAQPSQGLNPALIGSNNLELEKVQKQLEAKEAMLAKTMENFNSVMLSKEAQIKALKDDLNLLQKGHNFGDDHKLKLYERENQHLAKQVDTFRKQITAMVTAHKASQEMETKSMLAAALVEKEKQHHFELAKADKENELMKNQLVSVSNQLKAMKDSQAKVASLNQKAMALTESETQKLLDGGTESQIQRLQLEMSKKEAVFQNEIEKLQRQSLNKETMLSKFKENMVLVLKRKDDEIKDLKTRVEAQSQDALNLSAQKGGETAKEEKYWQDQILKTAKENDHLKTQLQNQRLEISSLKNELAQYQMGSQDNSKNIIFHQNIDRLEQQNASSEAMYEKSRENFSQMLEDKDGEIEQLQERINKMQQEGAKDNSAQHMIHLERQNQILSKMNESYKAKITNLVAELETLKTPDAKDDVKRLSMLNVQNKNQIESQKRELLRLNDKLNADNATILALKNEKGKVEQELRKLQGANRADKSTTNLDQDLKKAMLQNQILETQLTETMAKLKEAEAKLIEASKVQKAKNTVEDGQSKLKITHLEGSVKKLTQDLLENRNQLSDAKKELNKLRLEKTAMQNEIDKMKKESDKSKPAASPKKPVKGGKAA